MYKLKKLIAIALLSTFVMSFTAFAADIVPAASNEFRSTSARLISSSSLILSFSVKTISYANVLCSSSGVLHDSTTGNTLKYSPNKTSSGTGYSSTVPLSGATKGHKYYADVTFYADGLTKTVKTNTVTY